MTVTLPARRSASADQMRALADIVHAIRRRTTSARPSSRTSCSAGCRTNKVADLYNELKALGLAEPGAGTIVDVTACPGTDTCKLGIASSRGLAGELRTRLARQERHARRGDRRPADQGHRLLQLLRPAPRRRHRLLRQQPQRRRLHRPALPGDARRPVGRRTPARTGWRWARSRRSASPTWSTRLTDRYVARAPAATNRSRPGASASARRS